MSAHIQKKKKVVFVFESTSRLSRINLFIKQTRCNLEPWVLLLIVVNIFRIRTLIRDLNLFFLFLDITNLEIMTVRSIFEVEMVF